MRTLSLAVLPALLLGGAAQAQQVPYFSIDWRGPTVGAPDPTGAAITEGDILTPTGGAVIGPAFLPTITITGGFGAPGLGLGGYTGCVGHPGGTPCIVEVDALSFGRDYRLQDFGTTDGSQIVFSVDRFSNGIPGAPIPPNVTSESPFFDQATDIFGMAPGTPFATCNMVLGGNYAILDGNGAPSGSGALYPGLGLREPSLPFMFGCAAQGDDLDAFNADGPLTAAGGLILFSLDAQFPDPIQPCGNTGSAIAHGFRGGDILTATGLGPGVWAPSFALGLDFLGPDTDDLDALAVWDNGNGTFDPSPSPFAWGPGGPDMVLFSLRRGSALIGAPDSICGIPIEEGDILVPPVAGGASPFPGIFVFAESMGLTTLRSGTAVGNTGDDLDALDVTRPQLPILDCNNNGFEDALDILMGFSTDTNGNGIPDECESCITPFCFCDSTAPAPCGNFYSPGGCLNGTGVGGILSQTGGACSVAADDLVVTATQLPPGQFAILFMGSTNPMAPFGNGVRCAGGIVRRLSAPMPAFGGSLSFGPGLAAVSGGLIVPGSVWNLQCWYRDPAGPCGLPPFNVTNALQATFTP